MFAALCLRNPLLRSDLLISLPNLVVSSLARNLSSKAPNNTAVVQAQISKDVAKNLNETIGSFYQKLSPKTIIRESNHTELKQWTKHLLPILQQDPKLVELLDFIKKEKPPIVLLEGLDVPVLTPEETPSHARDLSNPQFIRKVKHTEILTALLFDRMGIKLELPFTTVYASKEEIDAIGSYKSSRKALEWHTDGWKNDPREYVGLLCMKGHENAITQVITAEQIIQYFKERGEEHLLKKLESSYLMGGLYEDQAAILKDGKIRFAEYGEIEGRDGDQTAKEALIKCLNELNSAIGTIMKPGDFLFVDNLRTIHRRTNAPDTKPEPYDGARVLVRSNGVNHK